MYSLLAFVTDTTHVYDVNTGSLSRLPQQARDIYFKAISKRSSPVENFVHLTQHNGDRLPAHLLSCLLVWNPVSAWRKALKKVVIGAVVGVIGSSTTSDQAELTVLLFKKQFFSLSCSEKGFIE